MSHSGGQLTRQVFPWRALLLLSAAVFVSVTAEFLPTGLLPDIAQGLSVTKPQAGLLVTVFAATVVLAALGLSFLTRRFSRKHLIIVALGVMALSNLVAAIAPQYDVMVGARMLGGLSHALFFGLSNAYVAYIVPPDRLGKGVAVVTAGGTLAFILGVPLGTALGHAFDWRWAFATLAFVILALAAALVFLLPVAQPSSTLTSEQQSQSWKKDPSLLPVVIAAFIVVAIITGHNTFYVFIAPYLIDAASFNPESVATLLFLYGGAGAVGVVVAGAIGDRYPTGGLATMIVVCSVAMTALALFPTHSLVVVITLMVWAGAFGGIPALLQLRVIQAASERLRDFAASVLVAAFNIGIGGGGAIGAALFEPLGVAALGLAGALALLIALAVVLVSASVLHRRIPSGPRSLQSS